MKIYSESKKQYVGIDVSKAKLDIFDGAQSQTIANEMSDIRDWLAPFKHSANEIHLVCEPSGGYEKKLVKAALKAGIIISVVNAKQVRDFAGAQGKLAKTDKIDAQILADYGQVFDPRPDVELSATQQSLSAVTRRRDRLVRQLAAEKVALPKADIAFVMADIKRSIGVFSRAVERCDKEIERLIDSEKSLKEKQKRMEQIKGIGKCASSILIAEMPELGSLTDKEAASLIGVAPFNRDSGRWRGKRTIRGGRGLIRRSLYMPALCAVRHNPILREFYQRLIAKNKPHKVAIVAVIRKMICLLNRILADPNYVPE